MTVEVCALATPNSAGPAESRTRVQNRIHVTSTSVAHLSPSPAAAGGCPGAFSPVSFPRLQPAGDGYKSSPTYDAPFRESRAGAPVERRPARRLPAGPRGMRCRSQLRFAWGFARSQTSAARNNDSVGPVETKVRPVSPFL